MKKAVILLLILMTLPFYGTAQNIENIDYISPFNNGVATKTDNINYPIFKKDRCLISQEKDGISYFGYIDKSGKTVIKPQFLNATNFNNDVAIVLELMREDIGKNQLNKDVYYYKYFEVLINTTGEITKYLSPDNATYIALDKSTLFTPPKILSRLLSNTVFTTQEKNKKWIIKKI